MFIIAWKKFDLKKHEKIKITPQKIAAAKRALKKERERAGLFTDELMRFKTIEERFEIQEQRRKNFVNRMRSFEAKMWIEARKLFRNLKHHPEVQKNIIKSWNKFPVKDPAYLIDLIHGELYTAGLATFRMKTFKAKIESIDENKSKKRK